eukprot:CAMPEP_0194269566 /NCGR_PEP_ID=MMETSP0169-20130528/3704_1 /TAXON_ID=218684 /ORGANISM="Corethron pennatum, Strain L29A3" /LENGTH=119 /DNA_ID=CAMNT_0039011251 /DNA_START=143 /DNA_END=502 /DNA_ORIENTATION=-
MSLKDQPEAVVINPPADYFLRFTIEPKDVMGVNIFHFTTGSNDEEGLQLVPAIWFNNGSTELKFFYGDTLMKGYILPYELELNKKHSIEVQVYGTKSSVFVNGALASQVTIGTRTLLIG